MQHTTNSKLSDLCDEYDLNEFLAADVVYRWLADNHSGQGSTEYAALSKLRSVYRPARSNSDHYSACQQWEAYYYLDDEPELAIALVDEICAYCAAA